MTWGHLQKWLLLKKEALLSSVMSKHYYCNHLLVIDWIVHSIIQLDAVALHCYISSSRVMLALTKCTPHSLIFPSDRTKCISYSVCSPQQWTVYHALFARSHCNMITEIFLGGKKHGGYKCFFHLQHFRIKWRTQFCVVFVKQVIQEKKMI